MHQKIMLLAALWLLGTITSVQAQNLLNPKLHPKFINQLQAPPVYNATNGGNFTVDVRQVEKNLGLISPATGQPLLTKVWGYDGHYPGPTFLARKGTPVSVLWRNKLKNGSDPLPHLLPIDPSIHWALSGQPDYQAEGIPLVTHLHGGHTESASDGLPEAWFTPDFAKTGMDFKKETYYYSNDQEAATIWYHDHALGITRLNVYAGLAGFYLITDDNEAALQASHKIPSGAYDLGLAIQDRMFTADGQLYYPTLPPAMGAPANSIMPEMFGDFILVNGKAWPVLDVEPRAYRFRILNGSDSRFYNLTLPGGLKFIQIGSDNGLLPSPVTLNSLLIAPGERRDVVIDFSGPGLKNKTIILQNSAKTPFPKGTPPDPQTTGQIMAFQVSKPLNAAVPMTQLPASLRPPIVPLQTSLAPRKLILAEMMDEYGRMKPMLGTVDQGVKEWHDPVTEVIQQNNTEVWEIYNLTPDAHPIHLHMVTMQLVSRQKFKAAVDMETSQPSNIRFQGQPAGPEPGENGWKDTYISYPGEVLRVIAKFDLAGKYVWHCHILSHEDHEMMRPFEVESANNNTRTAAQTAGKEETGLHLQAVPNPFTNQLQLRFTLAQKADVMLNIYDSKGALVKQLYQGSLDKGAQQLVVDGTGWSIGVYYCQLLINGKSTLRKLVLEK